MVSDKTLIEMLEKHRAELETDVAKKKLKEKTMNENHIAALEKLEKIFKKDQTMGLERKGREVLRILAIEGPKTGYDLHSGKKKIMSNSTWHYLRESLTKKGLIKIIREEPIKFRGRKRKFYGVTVLGLSAAIINTDLYYLIHIKSFMDKIAYYWKDLLPLILGKWDLFVKSGMEDYAISNFKVAAAIVDQQRRLRGFFKKKWGLHILENPQEYFTEHFYGTFHSPEWICQTFDTGAYSSIMKKTGKKVSDIILRKEFREQEEKWLKILRSDPELKDYVIKLFKRKLKETQIELKERIRLIKIMEGERELFEKKGS